MSFSLVAMSRGDSPVAMCGLLNAGASLVEHRLQGLQASAAAAGRLSSCSSLALELRYLGLVAPRHVGSSWTRIKPGSPTLAGRFLSNVPPGKPLKLNSFKWEYTTKAYLIC